MMFDDLNRPQENLWLLLERKRSKGYKYFYVDTLMEETGISNTGLRKNLNALKNEGLLTNEMEGKRTYVWQLTKYSRECYQLYLKTQKRLAVLKNVNGVI